VGSRAADFIKANNEGLRILNANLGGLDIVTDITVSIIFRLDDGAAHNNLLRWGANSGTGNRQFAFDLQPHLATAQFRGIYSDGGGNTLLTSQDTEYDVSVWCHAWMAVDISAKSANVWVNGTAPTIEASSSGAATTVQSIDSPLGIGDNWIGSLAFDGRMDEVRIYASALPDAWGRAEGLNYMDSSNFYTVSAEL
jgi:hypothetical protein